MEMELPRSEPAFVDRTEWRMDRGACHRRMMPPSLMFEIKKGLEVFHREHPDVPSFDVSQGDGGASLGGLSPMELMGVLALYLPREQATRYGKPNGDSVIRQMLLERYYRLGGCYGLTPDNLVLTDGGRDALQKWYQAIRFRTQMTGESLLVSPAPWGSYAHGSYISGFNLLRAPVTMDSFALTCDGVDASLGFAEQTGCPVRAAVFTSPGNPTGEYVPLEVLARRINHAAASGITYILLDRMYALVVDADVEVYDLRQLFDLLTPEARQALTVLDGLTKSVGASNVRAAHLLCGDATLAKTITALASHSVLPNVLGQACSHELYLHEDVRNHRWVRRITEPTSESRRQFKAFMTERGYRFTADQGYYAFVDVSDWIGGEFQNAHPLVATMTLDYGVAVVPGDVFCQPTFVRFSLANTPEYTLAAAARFHQALQSLALPA